MVKRLFKATVIVSSMTLISRLLGFVRDMLIARIFGVDVATDAFFVAFKIPNFLRRLFSEGAFSHTLIPAMVNYQDDRAALRQFIGKTAGTLAGWSLVITLAAILLSPLLVLALAPGFALHGQQLELAVPAMRIMLPFGFFIILVSFAGAVLNSRDRYAIPALTPVLLNVCMITAALWLAPKMEVPIMALAWGVFAAGVVQLLFQIPSLLRLGLLPKLTVKLKDPEVTQVMKKLLPATFGASVTQISVLMDTLFASFLVSGSVSWLYYSDRLVEFPLSILGLALSTVILPNLTKNHAAENPTAFSSTLDWGLRLAVLAGIPATIGLFVLAEPILSTLFQYDEFTVNDVYSAAKSLRAYSVGLLGYLFVKVLLPAFTSRLDLKTPVRYGTLAMIAGLLLNVLAIPMAHAGLALATSLGAIINAALLLKKLFKDRAYQPGNGWLLFLVRIVLASTLMTFCLYYFVDATWWHQWDSTDRMINLLKWISIGCFVYVMALAISGLRLKHLTGTNDRIGDF